MIAVLLINLGTPENPSPKSVRKYLAEFLMDPYVVDLPWVARAALVHGIILPTRPKKSAQAYQKIWERDRGSPLLFHSQDLLKKVQAELAKELDSESFHVELGMRYGLPSVFQALKKLKESEDPQDPYRQLVVVPLYPQYSLAATESSIQKVNIDLRRLGWQPKQVNFVRHFYNHSLFIKSFTKRIAHSIESFKPDFVLFSYHGLPERHISKLSGAKTHGCISKTLSNKKGEQESCSYSFNCCEREFEKIVPDCYRAQCIRTTQAIIDELKKQEITLHSDQFHTAFQSRLNSKWIQPFTDHFYRELPKKGVRRLLVASPSFVADCLETLEEISIRGLQEFRDHGGEALQLVPSLNSGEDWAYAVSQIVRSQLLSKTGFAEVGI